MSNSLSDNKRYATFEWIKVPLISIFVLVIVALPIIVSIAQEREKVVELMFSGEPIKAVSFTAGNKTVKSREKFSGSKDWLKDFAVNIKNTSGKNIKHISIGLHLLRPEEQKEIPPLHFTMSRGVRAKALRREDSKLEMKPSNSNEVVSIRLSENEYENIVKSLDELRYPRIDHIQVQIEEIIFDDGTAWSFGSWLIVDPNNPEKLIRDNTRSSANFGTASSLTGEGCIQVYPDDDFCEMENGVACYSRVQLYGGGGGNQELVDRYDACYTHDSNGERDQRCAAQKLVKLAVVCPTPTPTPEPTPTPCNYQQEELPGIESGSYELNCEICFDGVDNDCVNGQDWEDYHCIDCYSPVAIDTLGDGFDLTGAEDGVDFDIAGIRRPVRVSWTQGDDAWIALDRNGNGTIDSGRELFGSATSQPGSTGRNGFLALAQYDKPANAGNGDGAIDSRDAIFSSLRLWLDSNHNGFSEQSELHTLPSLGVAQLDLDYRESGRVDAHGNRFRYRAKVRDSQGSDLGRWAWDVFLRTESVTRENEFVLLQDHRVFSFSKPRCRG